MTQPDLLFPETASNWDSFAAYAAKTQEEWEAEQRGAEVSRWGEDGVLGGFQTILGDVGSIINALLGINLSSAGAVVDSMQAIVDAFAQTLIDLLGFIPIAGPWAHALGQGLLDWFNSTIDSIQDLGSKVNINPALPAWQSISNGDQAVDFNSCVDSITITPTVARWGFVRITKPMEKRSISVVCQKSATGVTGLFFDVYRINPDNTATWIYTSSNEVGNASSSALTGVTHAIPLENAIVTAAGDLYAVQIRMTGSTSVTLLSDNNTPDITPGNTLPKRLGGWRDPSGTDAPTSFDSTELDAVYDPVTPYVEFDMAEPTPFPVTIFDDFNDINLSATRWVNWRSTAFWPVIFQFLYLTVEGGKASFSGGQDGFQMAQTLSRLNMPTDACRLGVQVRNATGAFAWAGMNCADDWTSGAYLGVTNSLVEIRTFTSYSDFGTQRASAAYTVTDGEWLYMQYNGDTETYTVFGDNGFICAWNDSGALIPHGTPYQYGAIRLSQASGVHSAQFDAFKLWDTDEAVPVTPGGSGIAGATFPMNFPLTLASDVNSIAAVMAPATAVLTGVAAADALNAGIRPLTAELAGSVPTSGTLTATVQPAGAAMTGVQSLLTEPFDDLDNWSLIGTNASTLITVTGGHLSLSGITSSGTECQAVTSASYNIAGKSVQVETVAAGTATGYYAFGVSDAGFSVYARWLLYFNGFLYPQSNAGNLSAGFAYNATTHKYLRIRNTGGFTYYEYSSDGITWTTHVSGALTYYNSAAAYVRFTHAETAAAASTFDNVIIS